MRATWIHEPSFHSIKQLDIMKINTSNPVVLAVAKYYGINTYGKFRTWLSLMSANAAVYYYEDGKLHHTRVRTLRESFHS
jgi:hypothetical protein